MIVLEGITAFTLPIIILFFALLLFTCKGDLLHSFIDGAREGLMSCVNLLPTFLLVMVGVSFLFSSGAVDILCNIFMPLLKTIGVHEDMLPTIILRPFSGSGVTAVADRMFKVSGPDSLASKTACLLMGSTDTIIYTLSVYFSAAGIKKTRHALASSFIVFIFSVVFCTFVGNAVFS